MTISRWRALALSSLVVLAGCADGLPTTDDERVLPVDAETVEVTLPFELFAADFQVSGGFGSPVDLGEPYVANQYEGELDAHALIRFGPLPRSVLVAPAGGGAEQFDSTYVPVSGTLTLFFDTVSFRGALPLPLEFSATETPWHLRTATWTHAVDTIGGPAMWAEAGGGPARPIGSSEWPGPESDSLVVEVDSLTVTQWADTSRADRGLRITTPAAGSRIRITSALLRVQVASAVNPDTLLVVQPQSVAATFVYTPDPELSTTTFQIGGTPARRATFRIELPDRIDGDAAVCQRVTCPFELSPERLLYAGLILTPREGESRAFQPGDTLTLNARPVLAPDRLPRAPLGNAVQLLGQRVGPAGFQGPGGEPVEIPMTAYLRDVATGVAPSGNPIPTTLAILSQLEPATFEFATFFGPGTASPPSLRLILTISQGVTLP